MTNKLDSNKILKQKFLKKNNIIFSTKIYILKDSDPIEVKPTGIKGLIKLTDSLVIYEIDNKLERKINFTE